MYVHNLLVETLTRFGVDESDIRIITKLYWEPRAVFKWTMIEVAG